MRITNTTTLTTTETTQTMTRKTKSSRNIPPLSPLGARSRLIVEILFDCPVTSTSFQKTTSYFGRKSRKTMERL
eukprot:TCALIF_13787-PA protein Name:"Protein of unknown function" AED:0.57 eAED:0.62 QI:3/1/0/1/1/1/2/186/73